MAVMGTDIYFLSLAAVYMALFAYGLYRIQKCEAVPLDMQKEHVNMLVRPSPISMTTTEEGHTIITKMRRD